MCTPPETTLPVRTPAICVLVVLCLLYIFGQDETASRRLNRWCFKLLLAAVVYDAGLKI